MPKKALGLCLVCDDAAIGINFGVPTCMPCKAFFRRHAKKFETGAFKCEGDGDCKITYKFRRLCNHCRLAKCFDVGMKQSLILSDEERERRNKLVAINRLKRGAKVNQTADSPNTELQLIRMPPSPNQNLSASDQIMIANIFHAYESTCVVSRNNRFPNFPAYAHTSLIGLLNEVSPIVETYIEYFKLIPEFNRLMLDDKLRLTKNHFGTMININERLLYPLTSTNLLLTWSNVFPVIIRENLIKRNKILDEFICDPIILKLLLIILTLSSGNSRGINQVNLDLICDDSLSIFAAQNVYVELLWKYVSSRSLNQKTIVRCVTGLVRLILHIMKIDMCFDTFVMTFGHAIQQVEPVMQSMWPTVDDPEQIDAKNFDSNIITSD